MSPPAWWGDCRACLSCQIFLHNDLNQTLARGYGKHWHGDLVYWNIVLVLSLTLAHLHFSWSCTFITCLLCACLPPHCTRGMLWSVFWELPQVRVRELHCSWKQESRNTGSVVKERDWESWLFFSSSFSSCQVLAMCGFDFSFSDGILQFVDHHITSQLCLHSWWVHAAYCLAGPAFIFLKFPPDLLSKPFRKYVYLCSFFRNWFLKLHCLNFPYSVCECHKRLLPAQPTYICLLPVSTNSFLSNYHNSG